MIEILEGFPDNVIAVRAKGRVTRSDYDDVLVPRVTEAFRRRPKIRCYYELGAEYAGIRPGAMWEDFRVGMGHFTGWERVAVVTDVEWIRFAVNMFRFFMPGEIRVFETKEAEKARSWIIDRRER